MDNWQDQYLADITQIMREADELFQKGGGSTRHYLRDAFFPMLHEKGFEIKKSDESGEIETLKAENSKMRKALEGIVEMSIEIGVVNWEKIHDTATEALKTP